MRARNPMLAGVLLLLAVLCSQALWAASPVPEIGIVVMHGKGGSPGRLVNVLAEARKMPSSPTTRARAAPTR